VAAKGPSPLADAPGTRRPTATRGGRPRIRARRGAAADLLGLRDDSPESLWARRLTIGIAALSAILALLVGAEFVAGEASPADVLIVAALVAMTVLTLVTIRLVGARDRQRAAELEDTARLIRSLSRAVSPDAVVEAIAGEVGFATDADHVVIVRRRPRAWALDATLVSVGGEVAPSTTTLPSTDLVPAGRPEEASIRRLEAHVADAFGLRHTIAAPLVVESGLVGAIVLSRRTGQPWGDVARRRLGVSAAEASAALERAYTLSDAEARAQTDPLTGLPNRRRFDQAARDLAGRRRAGDRVGLLMIDLDHFKRLNDELGHPAGDRVLVAVARAIAGSVRDVDLPARVGGEEFAVILRDPSGAAEVAERLRGAIAAIDLSSHGIPGVTASVGVAIAVDPEEQVASLVRRADDALLRAKREGRDRVVVG
jgi:diguanylate cyclase (GGDEF)-like protein